MPLLLSSFVLRLSSSHQNCSDTKSELTYMTQTALVTIVIPCYNQARYLPETVASVVGQTFDRWEAVIVDDGSSDDTSAVARGLIERYPGRRISLISQANQGLGASRNIGIAATYAPYVLPLDADDL